MAKMNTAPTSDSPGATEHSTEGSLAEPAIKTVSETKNGGKKNDTTAKAEIPAFAREILKKFRFYPELYIGPAGGIYTADTAPAIRGVAVLYKNPYYES
jgi:hypothetical protein|nr:MAG TPA: hypothetical protein [Bacteriophage sp.]